MKAVTYSDVRKNLKSYLDQSYENHEPIIITRKDNKNMMIISVDDYNSMEETRYLKSSITNENRLCDSIKQYKNGDLTSFKLEDLNGEK